MRKQRNNAKSQGSKDDSPVSIEVEHNAQELFNEALASDSVRNINDLIKWEANDGGQSKSFTWYVSALLICVVAVALVNWLTKDLVSSATVFMAFLVMVIYGSRKPTTHNLQISHGVLSIDTKQYSLQNFKSFSIDERPGVEQVVLTPLKRFMPSLSLPLESKTAPDVINLLQGYLPIEDHKKDAIDDLISRFRL